MIIKKTYVLCPGNTVTGGPELLHQLVSTLNNAGGEAYIIYYPFHEDFEVPTAYSKYNVNVERYHALSFSSNISIVIPEIYSGLARKFPCPNVFIWWLSVDNYFEKIPKGFINGLKSSLKRFMKYKNAEPKQLRLDEFVKYRNLVQSKYAEEFLALHGCKSEVLSDYLNEEHFIRRDNSSLKEDIICFNPKKGFEITREIIDFLPEYKFVPIVNLNSSQVANLLERAKVYIDFGNHPGKDRIPREAAMANCVVITGTRGSAKNSSDIPVPSRYKIEEGSTGFLSRVQTVLNDSIYFYDSVIVDFEPYRDIIKNERTAFENQAIKLFK